jgi:ferredoxin--NADP+ reductase
MTATEPKIGAQLQIKRDVSEGLAVFRFELAQDFSFKPGQYATLWLTHRDKTIPRPYSIASSPSESRCLEFYINLVEHGRLTPSLWDPEVLDGLQRRSPGTRIEITGPKGRFTLDPGDHRDLVFAASGTGLAPFISMIRELNGDYLSSPETCRRRNVLVIHGASFSRNLGYHEELRALAVESTNDSRRKFAVVYLPTISRPHMEPSWTGLRGRAESLFDCTDTRESNVETPSSALKDTLRVLLRPETHAVYVCGHPGTVDKIERILTSRGFRQDVDVKREKYYR